MDRSGAPKGQDNTPNHTNDSQNSGTLGNAPPRVGGDPPSPPEHSNPNRNSGQPPWWRQLPIWTFIGEMVLVAITLRIACIYSGQLDQMIESNKISSESLQSVQRAFVRWVGFGANHILRRTPSGDQKSWSFKNSWENSGNTTAAGVVQYFSVDELPNEPNDQQFKGDIKSLNFPVTVIGPKGSLESQEIEKPQSFLLGKGRNPTHTIESNRGLFFWGWIVYRDVFKDTKPHVTEICMRLTGVNYPATAIPKGGFIPANTFPGLTYSGCREHNCVDNYCKDYQSLAAMTPQ